MSSRNRIGDRISWEESDNTLVTVINQKTTPLNLILIGAWALSMLFCAGVFINYTMNPIEKDDAWFFAVISAFAIFFVYKSMKVFLWRVIGKEIIVIKPDFVSIQNAFGKLGKRQFLFPERIKGMKYVPKNDAKFMETLENASFSIGGDRIEIQDNQKTYVFGKQISAKEANLLMSLLNKHIKKAARLSRDGRSK
ncbi:MAG: hypothetical protein HRT74_12040 [Flavobacteriales bacterium]|nr:hypothetical protein [Flavobacteriales bacterium]